MEENPEGPGVRFDGVMPSGECLGGSPLVRDAVVMEEVDVLRSDTLGAGLGAACTLPPHSMDRLGEPSAWWASVRSGPTLRQGSLGPVLPELSRQNPPQQALP